MFAVQYRLEGSLWSLLILCLQSQPQAEHCKYWREYDTLKKYRWFIRTI